MDELLAYLAVPVVVVTFLVCRRIISCCRHNNDEYGHRRPILESSSRNISYTRGYYAPVKPTPILPSYNNQRDHSRLLQASSSHNIPATRDFYVPTKSTVKTLTIHKHGRNVTSTSRIPPPRKGRSSITVLSKALLSEEGENVSNKEDLREKALRMKREGQEALRLAKQAHRRRDFSAEAMHKQNARVLECAMERLNKEAAKAIFNQKNWVLWPIASRSQSHAY